MRFEGRLVRFNDNSYNVFTPGTKILYLGQNLKVGEIQFIPFVWEWNDHNIIGYVDTIKIDKNYIWVYGEIKNAEFINNIIKKEKITNIGLGGFYSILESHSEGERRILDTLDLRYISTRLDTNEEMDRVITRLED